VIDFTAKWSEKTEIPVARFIRWIGISTSKFYDWRRRYGKANEHNGKIPRDFWIEDWERAEIIRFHDENPLEGYRRLTFMMLDLEIVAVSPSTTWRVLSQEGRLRRWNAKPSKKGKGFAQPSGPHRHWHTDVAYINVRGTFYFLLTVLDGYSRFIVHWDLRESMTEADVEVVLQRARERFPGENPRVITDNGPQFIAKDFKEFIRICGMSHVKTSPYYPQSNGKIERWHKSLKGECIRPGVPLSLDDGRRMIGNYVDHYNNHRLHSAIGYVTPKDKLEGRTDEIFALRDRRLEIAREMRRERRASQRRGASANSSESPTSTPTNPKRHSEEFLRELRNDVPVGSVVEALGIPTAHRGSRVTARCPSCSKFHTAFHDSSNLLRCFDCEESFNTLDLVVQERRVTFDEAVRIVAALRPRGAQGPVSPEGRCSETEHAHGPGPG